MSTEKVTQIPTSDIEPNNEEHVQKASGIEVSGSESKNSEDESQELRILSSNTSTEYVKSRGVKRIENVKLLMSKSRGTTIGFWVCLMVVAWVFSLDASTTGNYAIPATSSFSRHSMIASVNVATNIIGSVIQPFQAKFSDITSRPLCFAISLLLYVIGIVIAASSSTISAYIVGSVLLAVGTNGISFLRDVIVADLSDLKWRGLVNSLMTSPYLINPWFSGLIVDAILARNWRWGYGMFAIITPVTVIPALYVMYFYEKKAQKLVPKEPKSKKSYIQIIWDAGIHIDAFGLILLGFGWALLLLPFSLVPYANGSWGNPSMIAMVVVGPVILVAFVIYEVFIAPFPSFPKRIIKNKTFLTCVLINFLYMLGDGIREQYLSTILWISKDWSDQNWTYFNNTLNMSLCFFAIVAGITCRITHRYKYMQCFGIFMRMVSYCIPLRAQGTTANTASFVMCQVIMGFGSAYSTIGTSISSEASVPHQDLSLVMALLLLWSNIGYSIGSTISGAVWTNRVPGYMREFIPSTYTDEEVYAYYTDMSLLRELPIDNEARQGATKAFSYVAVYLFAPPIALEFVNFLLSFFQTNYYLGDTQNAIEDQNGQSPINPDKEFVKPETMKEKILYLLN